MFVKIKKVSNTNIFSNRYLFNGLWINIENCSVSTFNSVF